MDKKAQMREWIREMIIEELNAYLKEQDLEEVSTSGAAGAYQSPFAFSGKDQSFRKKNAEQAGMRLVGFDDIGHGKVDTDESKQRKIVKKNNKSTIVKKHGK